MGSLCPVVAAFANLLNSAGVIIATYRKPNLAPQEVVYWVASCVM